MKIHKLFLLLLTSIYSLNSSAQKLKNDSSKAVLSFNIGFYQAQAFEAGNRFNYSEPEWSNSYYTIEDFNFASLGIVLSKKIVLKDFPFVVSANMGWLALNTEFHYVDFFNRIHNKSTLRFNYLYLRPEVKIGIYKQLWAGPIIQIDAMLKDKIIDGEESSLENFGIYKDGRLTNFNRLNFKWGAQVGFTIAKRFQPGAFILYGLPKIVDVPGNQKPTLYCSQGGFYLNIRIK